MFHTYTYGKESKQFLILSPRQANLINRFTTAFFLSQENFLKTNGRRWQPSEPLFFLFDKNFNEKELERYNRLAKKLNLQHKVRNIIFDLFRIDVSTEPMADYLVKRV